MRAAGATYKVTKNRLTKRALEGTKFQALQPLFTGPTAIAYSDDPVAAAKVCVEFAKKNEKLTVVGGARWGGARHRAVKNLGAVAVARRALRARLIGSCRRRPPSWPVSAGARQSAWHGCSAPMAQKRTQRKPCEKSDKFKPRRLKNG